MSGGSWFNKNVIILEDNNSSSTHVDNRQKDNLILGNSPADGLDDTTLTEKAEYSISLDEQQNKF